MKRYWIGLFRSARLGLAGLLVLILLAGCALPNCMSGEEWRSGTTDGQPSALATTGKICSDKSRYQLGETVHFTISVKNEMKEPIVLDGGKSPVLDIEVGSVSMSRRSTYPPAIPTRIELQPGQTYEITWDWPPPDVDVNEARGSYGWMDVHGYWTGLDGGRGSLGLDHIEYGPILEPGL